MTSRSLRRLAADHAALHSQPLPPNYLFPPGADDTDDLTRLDILLAGPTHTPFAAGVWTLHLNIPTDYPQQPPTAFFRTPIFHPNVDPHTGAVCVETLKRDWDAKLTLRDVLVTISCLLIQPNPDSALNAEAGSLIQDNYQAFARRAELMTSIHGVIPTTLRNVVRDAQMRGQEDAQARITSDEPAETAAAPIRRRRPPARQRGIVSMRRSNASPSGGVTRRRQQAELSNPFVVEAGNDDVFGIPNPDTRPDTRPGTHIPLDDDSSILEDADQENDETRSPKKAKAPRASTPKRPPGAPIPLGELTLEGPSSSEMEDSSDAEYPPSPKKSSSPFKYPAKRRPQLQPRAESSRDAAARNVTPTISVFTPSLAHDSSYYVADELDSPRKTKIMQETSKRAPLFPSLSTSPDYGGIFKVRSPPSAEKRARKREELERKLWRLCGGDVERWNRGDFDGEVFGKKATRW